MQIILNGQPHALSHAVTIVELLQALGRAEGRVAVEVNREIVPRGRHAEHRLQDGDVVELVQAMGGG